MTRSAEQVTAVAESRAKGIQVGPLSLAHVTGTAKVILMPDGKATRSSSLEIAGASVSGTPVATVPGDPGETVRALNAALAPTKMGVEYLASQDIPGGLVSAVLSVTVPFPAGGNDGTFRVLLGRASAALRTEEGGAVVVEMPVPPWTGTVDGPAPATPPANGVESPAAAPLTVSPAFPTAPLPEPSGGYGAGSVAMGLEVQPSVTGVDPSAATAPAANGTLTPSRGAREAALPLQLSAGRLTFGSAYAVLALLVAAGVAVNQVVRRTRRKLA